MCDISVSYFEKYRSISFGDERRVKESGGRGAREKSGFYGKDIIWVRGEIVSQRDPGSKFAQQTACSRPPISGRR